MIKIEIFSKKYNSKLQKFLIRELKKIKDDSLIFSFSKEILLNYFFFIFKMGGIVFLITQNKKIYGCMVLEKSSKNTFSFLKKNSFAIVKNLIFSKHLSDKIILAKLVFNWFFFKENRTNYNNNIVIIAIKKRLRRKKFGSKLIRALKTKIKNKIHVMTDVNNLGAQKFYLKNGFIKKRKINYGLRKLIVFYIK